jgi:uncharacterized protein involved in exopolysaccharide biosynthesis
VTQRAFVPDSPEIRLVSFTDVLTRVTTHRGLVGALTGLGLIVGVALAFLLPSRYTAESRIMGQSSTRTSMPAGIAGLAAQFGLPLELGGGASSPQYYADLLQSREVLEALLLTPFAVADASSRRETLLEQLDFSGDTDALRVFKAVRYLRKHTDIDAAKSGIITVGLTLPRAQLAADATNRLVDLVNAFNIERLQFQSRQQRVFTERRLKEVEGELRAAERDQLAFLERNRTVTGSPALQAEATRLQRVVQAKQEVFLTLTRSFEEARIAEAKDVPTVTIIDHAAPPARRSWPVRWAVILLGVLGGLLAGVGWAVAQDAIARARDTVAAAKGGVRSPASGAEPESRPMPNPRHAPASVP